MAMTDREQQIDQLQRRLGWEAGGPLAEISDRATQTLVSLVSAVVRWLRMSGEDAPLVSILLAFQVGFALGRWGGDRA